MIQASRSLTASSLSAALIRRRKPLMLAPPVSPVAVPLEIGEDEIAPRWSGWRQDLRFFAGCYVAGLIFFFIMLS